MLGQPDSQMTPYVRKNRGRHHIESKRQSVLRALNALLGLPRVHPEFLHELRIDLRRLEAWLELVGKGRAADTLRSCLSSLSPLRTMQVLETWLVRHKASPADTRKVRNAISSLTQQLEEDQSVEAIRAEVEKIGRLDQTPGSARQRTVWQQHRTTLAPLLAELRHKPKRKQLHDLRLRLKRIRYQLEQLRPRSSWERKFLAKLKKTQETLGAYEERAAFRKLAAQLELSSIATITKRWKRSRKRARRLPREMDWLLLSLQRLAERPSAPPEQGATRRNLHLRGKLTPS